ncbi:maleylpyruvate isomerase N-terminal domain-containing protein [Micromonospora sp. NPDC049679]|uniref:maleylpyruvate isomerase N-terminal domain-containing protein n=1 Tax=Micromonospora sp. NPDC049679 TaxID=3155920 RepID=UPI0033E46D63
MTTPIRVAYLHAAAAAAVTLLRDPAVARSWETPSALPEFAVSGLAGHLAQQIFRVPEVLAGEVPASAPIALLEHYARSRWLDAGVDDGANVAIRRGGDDAAADGAAALAGRADGAVERLRELLPAEPVDRVVHLPWGPWSLTLDDFLTTRLMELAVHADDLAVSVGVETPALPPEVIEPVIDLLSRLALRRHGAAAVLRALSRSERAPRTISAL